MSTQTNQTHRHGTERVLLEGFDGRNTMRFVLHGGEPSYSSDARHCRWKLTGIQIGRDADSDIALTSPVVSRHHAVLMACVEQMVVIDLGSSNGTFLNGQRIEPGRPAPVSPGSELSFGHGATFTVSC